MRGCGFWNGGGSTMISLNFQYLPECEKRCSEVKAFTIRPGGFLEPLLGFRRVDAETLEFVVAIALADTEFQAPARKQVERGSLFGQQNGIVPGQHHDGRTDPNRGGLGGHPAQQVHAGRDLTEAGEMMLDDEGRLIAQRFGLDVVFDIVLEPLSAVDVRAAALRLRASEQSEFHERSPMLLIVR